MYLSKNKKSGIWYAYYRKENGKKTRISTGETNKSQAYKFLNDFEKKVKQRQNKTEISLEELSQKYLNVVSITHTVESYKMTKKMINYFLDYAGKETPVSKIDKSIAEGFILGTYEHAKWHAALQLRHLKAFFNRAIGWGYIEKNPFKGIKLSIPENHPAFINVDELNSIVSKETDNTLKQIYKFAFYTGCRLSEILNLEWDDVNLSTKEIRVRNKNGYTTKSKRERVIPM
jgi:integrase